MTTYKGIEIRECGRFFSDYGDENCELTEGVYYLLLRSPTMAGRDPSYHLRTEPGRTNMSHAVRLEGWLGTTNDVAWYAEGCVEVYRNKAGHLRIRRTERTPAVEVAE